MVICLERGADLHMAQLMPLPLTVSCFSNIQIGFTFLVPAHLGSPGKGPLNGCVCVCVTLLDLGNCLLLTLMQLYQSVMQLYWVHVTNSRREGTLTRCLHVTTGRTTGCNV